MNQSMERVHEYAVALCKAARVFTLVQIAKHPELSWRTQPRKRAGEFLGPWKKEFEVLPAMHGKPFVWRFSTKGKALYGAEYLRIHPASKKIDHWLTIGDLWQAMTHTAGRPSTFLTEPKDSCDFDIYTVWQNRPYLIEIQRSKLSSKEWSKKWCKREKWYQEQGYKNAPWQNGKTIIVPRPILICTEGVKATNVPGFVMNFDSIDSFTQKMSSKLQVK